MRLHIALSYFLRTKTYYVLSLFPTNHLKLTRSRSWSMSCAAMITPRLRQPLVLHVHQIPLGSSPNHIVLGDVSSNTICSILDCF